MINDGEYLLVDGFNMFQPTPVKKRKNVSCSPYSHMESQKIPWFQSPLNRAFQVSEKL